jgi:hypothetical protein
LHIEPHVHEQFVQDFGLNMLNTLTSKENRSTAHKRRIHVFDERGGIMGGRGDTIQQYQNLTTGVFHSKTRKVVGVRYRCIPNDLTSPEVGAFHTHPALYDPDVDKVRRRIDQLIWLSDMDKKAFYKQHEMYGYEWHFIGCIDIGAFNIHDLKKGQPYPRYVFRYPRLEEVMAKLEPQILHYDRILRGQGATNRDVSRPGVLTELVQDLTQLDGHVLDILGSQDHEVVSSLARQVATECQLRGYTLGQIAILLEKTIPAAKALQHGLENQPVATFKSQLLQSYDRLAQLV